MEVSAFSPAGGGVSAAAAGAFQQQVVLGRGGGETGGGGGAAGTAGAAETGIDVWTTLVLFVSLYLSVLTDSSKSPSFNLNSASLDLLRALMSSVIS